MTLAIAFKLMRPRSGLGASEVSGQTVWPMGAHETPSPETASRQVRSPNQQARSPHQEVCLVVWALETMSRRTCWAEATSPKRRSGKRRAGTPSGSSTRAWFHALVSREIWAAIFPRHLLAWSEAWLIAERQSPAVDSRRRGRGRRSDQRHESPLSHGADVANRNRAFNSGR